MNGVLQFSAACIRYVAYVALQRGIALICRDVGLSVACSLAAQMFHVAQFSRLRARMNAISRASATAAAAEHCNKSDIGVFFLPRCRFSSSQLRSAWLGLRDRRE